MTVCYTSQPNTFRSSLAAFRSPGFERPDSQPNRSLLLSALPPNGAPKVSSDRDVLSTVLIISDLAQDDYRCTYHDGAFGSVRFYLIRYHRTYCHNQYDTSYHYDLLGISIAQA